MLNCLWTDPESSLCFCPIWSYCNGSVDSDDCSDRQRIDTRWGSWVLEVPRNASSCLKWHFPDYLHICNIVSFLIAFVASARELICFLWLRSCGWILIYWDGADGATRAQLTSSCLQWPWCSIQHVLPTVAQFRVRCKESLHEQPVAKSDAKPTISSTKLAMT